MFGHEPRLTVDEQVLLRRSADRASTQRRIRLSLLSGAVLAAAVATAAWAVPPWRSIAAVFVAYVAVTTWERVVYGRSLLRYKALADKLHRLLADADRRGGPGPG